MEFILYIAALIGVFYFISEWNNAKYESEYPLTLEMYLAENPDCKTNHGVKCNGCGSKSLRNMGRSGATCEKRMISCNHCGKRLYRVKN